MPRFELVHNIIPPYRRHMFELMAREFNRRGWSFFVHFMAKHHADRPSHWHADRQQLNFPHRFYPDYGFKFRGRKIHFNPAIIWRQMVRPPQALMIAGMDSLTSMGCLACSRAPLRVYWTEGNPHKMGRTTGFVGRVKRFLLNRCNLYAVPGVFTEKYLSNLTGRELASDEIVRWSNLVDGMAFMNPTEESLNSAEKLLKTLSVGTGTPWAIWPARLSSEKGILEFLPIWTAEAPSEWHLVILGEGPLHGEVSRMIVDLNLTGRVHVVPYVQSVEMAGLYAKAHLMALPSINDANPLSIVEALFAGLPLVVSDRVGNWPEAVEIGVNGMVASPFDAKAMGAAVRWGTSLSVDARVEAKCVSQSRAHLHWGAESVVRQFVTSVILLESK